MTTALKVNLGFLIQLFNSSFQTIRDMRIFVERVGNGVDLNLDSLKSTHAIMCAKKWKHLYVEKPANFTLSAKDVRNSVTRFPNMLDVPTRVFFVSACEIVKHAEVLPSLPVLATFLNDLLFLHHNQYINDFWRSIYGLVDVIVLRLSSRTFNKVEIQLCQLLIILGKTEKVGLVIIRKLHMVLELYIDYQEALEWKVTMEEQHTEMCMLIVNVIIQILEEHVNSLKAGHDFQDLFQTLQYFKECLTNRLLVDDIEYCLGLLPS